MTDRGQLVIVAAAVLAVALLPVVAAYLQFGFHPDVGAASDDGDPVGSVDRTATRALERAAADVPRQFAWSARREAARHVVADVAPTVAALQAAAPPDATRRVVRNASAARRAANATCPAGPDRAFGDCRAVSGVVVQNRSGRTHVVAVALDVTQVGPDRSVAATLLVERVTR